MTQKPQRLGGRAARRVRRSSPIPTDERPVSPGHFGGRYQPLSESEISSIHSAVLDTLETIGLANAVPSQLEEYGRIQYELVAVPLI